METDNGKNETMDGQTFKRFKFELYDRIRL